MACFSLCGICDGDSDFARTFLLLTGQGLCVMLTYRNENHKRGEPVRQAERKINLRPYLIWVMPTEGL